MRFLGRDHEAAFLVGPGTLEITTTTEITYKVFATSIDDVDVIRRFISAANNPYDITYQLRLSATDFNGVDWSCGWTLPTFEEPFESVWILTGSIQSMTTMVTGSWVSQMSSVELVFTNKLPLPWTESLLSITTIDGVEVGRKQAGGRHILQCLGSEIIFSCRPGSDALIVSAQTTTELPHPHLENWIAEPLRILLGQPVYPRLIARNFGDGRGFVSLHASPPLLHTPGRAALMRTKPLETWPKFWKLYGKFLNVIASARDASGLRNFEAHPITRFHVEITQATYGSRWILCLTLASSIEGLAKLLMRDGEQTSTSPSQDIKDLQSYVEAWDGNNDLRSKIIGYLGNLRSISVGKYLRKLEGKGILNRKHSAAWESVRNEVMHGNLISPWGGRKEDEQIGLLVDLVQILTRQLIQSED